VATIPEENFVYHLCLVASKILDRGARRKQAHADRLVELRPGDSPVRLATRILWVVDVAALDAEDAVGCLVEVHGFIQSSGCQVFDGRHDGSFRFSPPSLDAA